jgi:hypothetical protein
MSAEDPGKTRSHAADSGDFDTNTEPMETPEPTDSNASRRCGAKTRNGTPCQKYPAEGGARCRFHGGASTGPADVASLEGNDHAAGNPGGGAPEGNANAEIHGGFADWEKAYERFDEETQAYIDRIAEDYRETAAEHAPEVPAEERAELVLEMATLMLMSRRADADVFCDPDGSGSGRGLVIESEVTIDGETYTTKKLNPAFRATTSHFNREYEIAEKLSLWPGFQDDTGGW